MRPRHPRHTAPPEAITAEYGGRPLITPTGRRLRSVGELDEIVEHGAALAALDAAPDGALEIEGRTLLPGLIDAHAHLSSDLSRSRDSARRLNSPASSHVTSS